MAVYSNAQSQIINPQRYWTFNSSNAPSDSMGINNLNFNIYQSQYSIGTNGQVGKYLTLNENSWLIDGGPMTLNTGLTVEFLLKPGYKFNSTKLIFRGDDVFYVRIDYPKITFYTYHITGSGANIMDEFVIDLNGLGRKSYGYYVDGNWHHMVFKLNAANGIKEVWVDGQLPQGFSKTLATGTIPNAGNLNVYLNHNVSYVKYFGSIDEIAVYNTAIPSSLIYKHYLGVQNGQPYSFLNDYAQPIPAPSPVTSGIDINEYAPGHPNVTVSAIDQLNTYPTPRYRPGHTMNPNFNWMDPKYMGGLFQPGVTTQMAVNNSVTIQTELARNFNYYFNVGASNDVFDNAWVATANANPDFKLGMTVFRAQLNGNRPDLTSQNKPNDHYLQNAAGQYLDPDGNVTTTYKYWRPTAPTSSYTADGNNILNSLNYLFSNLTRGVDLINENGEVFPLITEAAASKDPVVTAAKNASGLDWETFLGRKFKENETQSYRDIFMAHPRMANGKFTEFAIDGYTQYRYKYSEARKVNTMINGQYYSTPDFYPRWPWNWRNWASAWHGWQWMVETRVHELGVGDKLNSPFVCAGWDMNEENNMRPAQWLGLLKCLNMAGAEFFYACYFSLSAPFPDSKNWIWQAVMPSYAQATASRYEDLIRNGSLMNGDVANSYINPTGPGFSFWSGDLRKLVVVRKHNTQLRYAITGTLQPNSNMINTTENAGVATIMLDGQQISFNVKRQGSTYIYDKTGAAPVFYQLDGWHESTHPSRWTKNFNIEAELFDNVNTQVILKTTVPAGTPTGNYTNYTTVVAWPDNATAFTPVEYKFRPRSGANNELYLWIKARSRGGATSMNIQLDNGTSKSIGCISDTNYTWYRYDACTQLPIIFQGLNLQDHILRITPGNTKLEIDAIILSADPSLILNNDPPTCSTASATITANGPTTFCQGGNVVLTASSGTSYLWTPGGQTTQSIFVGLQGNYSVTVGNGTGCSAVAQPVIVSVIAPPAAAITVNGPTTLQPGQTTTLIASQGSSWLWSPNGETTQSITVSTAGTYSVSVTNSGGCSATSTGVVITLAPVSGPPATITASGSTEICPGTNITLTASPGSAYIWTPGGQTTQSITVSSAGIYSVDVTDPLSGAISGAMIEIIANPVPSAPGIMTSYIPNSSYQLTAYEPTAHSYRWSNGSTAQTINVSNPGTFSVVAINGLGCESSAQSMIVSTITPQPCAQPNMLSQYAITNTEAVVSWNPAVTADSFRVVYTQLSNSSTASVNVPGNTSSVLLEDLAPGEAYKWTVMTLCGASQLISAQMQFNTLSGAMQCGSTPQNLKNEHVNSTFAKVSWYNTNGDKFVIRYREVGTTTYSYRRVYNSTTAGMIQGLLPVTTYEWSVRSMCGSNVSLYSQPKMFTTLPVCPSVGTVSVIDVAFDQALIGWNGAIAVDTIRIRYALSGTTDYRIIKIAGTPNPGRHFIRGLLAETSYDVWVSTLCSTGALSLWGSPVTFTTLPEPILRDTEDGGPLLLNAYPNPTRYQIGYAFQSKDDSPYIVKVCDMTGRELLSEIREAHEGLNGDKLSLAGFASGLYMLIVQKGPMMGKFKFNISE